MEQLRGNFIANEWHRPTGGAVLHSVNPATDGEHVAEAVTDPSHAQLAVDAARDAFPAWSALTTDERLAALRRVARELDPRTEALARAVTQEMGKVLRESRVEARSLIQRIAMVADHQIPQVRTWSPPGTDGECRYHPLGTIAVVGPYNFPLHLVHAHVIPALATGNTVVIKPSERTPLAAQRYIEAFAAAGLPPIVQMVQGGADVGRALTTAQGLRGVAFTGSWPVGNAIQRALIDRPEVLVALEMGGQNMAIVLADADIDQALEGVLLGGYLTTGQRCTCTARVLVERAVAPQLIERLVAAAGRLTWGDPTTDVFMGPLASVADRDRVDALCKAGVDAGAEVLLRAAPRPDLTASGAWRGPSIHLIARDHDSAYTREEVFGPDLAITIVDDLDDAIDIVNQSAYGLSISVFSARRAALEAVYQHTRVGCVNWNRSTNRASGAMPFGGVGRSGNYRPAGSDAVRYTTFPVQLQWNEPGLLEGDPHVRDILVGGDPMTALEIRHSAEEICEPYGLYPDVDPIRSLTLPAAQLSRVPHLREPLLQALQSRGVDASLNDGALRVALATGPVAQASVLEALEDSLYSVRYLDPARFLGGRPRGARVPAGDALSLPRSEAMMARLVGDGFVPDDKKPPVIDPYRSRGPYLASVDDDPLVILDAAGQIATHAAGMSPPATQEALWTGRFGHWPIANGAEAGGSSPEQELSSLLRKHAGHHPWVRLCNSGGEADELALAACADKRPGKRAIVSFIGSFHGRTLQALHATWNPSKRERFELDGFRARWVEWPTFERPADPAPDPTGWLDAWSQRQGAPPDAGDDPQLARDVEALLAVRAHLADDAVACVFTEPMQSEGGERYATARFFRGLRALTTAFDVPLVMDEVQTGFHLGGPFFWHSMFDLPAPPDVITCAKKAQLGATLARMPIPAAADVHQTSVVRGLVHAELLHHAVPDKMLHDVAERLAALAARHPEHVLTPRATGYAFGFDLPSAADRDYLVNQRLWRGYMVYGAGDLALRFRLHPEMSRRTITGLFQRLDQSLTDLREGKPVAWRQGGLEGVADAAPPWPRAPMQLGAGYSVVRIGPAEWPDLRRAYEALQRAVYEPARQDDFDHFTALIEDPGTICFAVLHGQGLPPRGALAGACFGVPLEHVGYLDGPRQDPMRGEANTLYAGDLTVHPDHRGQGIGKVLKRAQIVAAMQATWRDGRPRFQFLSGRTRVGKATQMGQLNARYGAVRVRRYEGQYGEDGAAADYYRICLTTPRLPDPARVRSPLAPGAVLDLDPRLDQRLGSVERWGPGLDALASRYHKGQMTGAVLNKLSLCNFVTPAVVRTFEALRVLAPKRLGHLITASGRSETLDKTLRALKYHRPEGTQVISLGPVWAGRGTAAARSVGRPAGDPRNWFGWPALSDPTTAPERALDDLRRALADHPERVLGVLIEAVYERTGRAVPEALWAPLRALCDEHDVPLVLGENATAAWRSGRGMWRADTLPVAVDAVMWFAGGQLGVAYVSDRYHVAEKLTLISTWDGDETSLTRLLWELRAIRRRPVGAMAAALEAALAPLGDVDGEGLYRSVLTVSPELLRKRLAARSVQVGLTPEGALLFAPPLDVTEAEIARLAEAVKDIL